MEENNLYSKFFKECLNIPEMEESNCYLYNCSDEKIFNILTLENHIKLTGSTKEPLKNATSGDILGVSNNNKNKMYFYKILSKTLEKVELSFHNSEYMQFIEQPVKDKMPMDGKLEKVNNILPYVYQAMNDLYKIDDMYVWKIKIHNNEDIGADSLYFLQQYLLEAPGINIEDFSIKIRVQSPGTIIFTTTKAKAIAAIIFAFTHLNKIKDRTINTLQNLLVGVGNTRTKYSSIISDMKNISKRGKVYAKDQLRDSKKVIRIRALNAEALTFNDIPLPSKGVLEEVKYNFNKLSKSIAGAINTKEMNKIKEDMNKNLLAYFLADLKTMTPKQIKKYTVNNLTADVRSIYEDFAANKLDELIEKTLEKRIVPNLMKNLESRLSVEEKEQVVSILREKARGQMFDHFEYQLLNYGNERIIKQAHLQAKEALKKRKAQKIYEQIPEVDELASKSVVRKKIRTERS